MKIQETFEMKHTIQKYEKSLEQIRPKPNDRKSVNACYSACSISDSSKFDIPCYVTDDDNSEHNAVQYCTINELGTTNCEHQPEEEEEEYFDDDEAESLSPQVIPSHRLIDESYEMNSINVENVRQQQIRRDVENVSSSSSTELETVFEQQPIKHEVHQSHEDFEFVIKPSISVNIQDSIRSNSVHECDSSESEQQTKQTDFFRESRIAVNQHMSIFIKKLSNEIVDQKSTTDLYMDESTEGSNIIREVFDKKSQDNFLLLQKHFLRWVHFNTIEKLKRRNPAHSRLQKMEAFLQNITLERKRALNKIRRPVHVLAINKNRRMALHDSSMKSPRMLARTFHNK